jgi:hypothetical protein
MMSYEAVLELISENGWDEFVEGHTNSEETHLIFLNSRTIRIWEAKVLVTGDGPVKLFDMADPEFIDDFEDFIRENWVDDES